MLNADDPNVLKMSAYTDAKVICWRDDESSHPLVRKHPRRRARLRAGAGRERPHDHALRQAGSHIPLLWTHPIPATLKAALHNVQNAMVASAMAFSMGIKLDAIRHGLRTFDTTFFQAPGRMNVRRTPVQG